LNRDPGRARWWRGELAIALVVYVVLGTVLCAGAFTHFENLGGKDWEGAFGQAQAELSTLRDHGQWPHWNPWRSGGQPSFAQPVSMLLSPVTPFVLAFGVVAGFKLALVPLYVLGCLGTWVLAGHLGLRGRARLVPGIVLFGSSLYPLYLCGGLPNWLCAMAFLPWLFWAHRRAGEDRRCLVLAAVLYAATILCGAVDRFLFLPVLLGLDALLLAGRDRSARPLLTLAATLALGLALSAVKVVPLFEIYRSHPREMEAATRFVAPRLLGRLFLDPDLPELVSLRGAFVGSLYWVNAGSYVGPLALALAGTAVVMRWRRAWPLLVLALLVTWLSFGSGVSPSAWELLHAIPGLASLRGPERLILFVTFLVALLAGLGWQALHARLEGRRWRGWAEGVVLVALVAPLVVVNAPISRAAFVVEPSGDVRGGGWFSPSPERPPFRQARFPGHPLQWVAPLYEPVLKNRGSVTSLPNIPIERAARAEDQPDYRGEAFLRRDSGQVELEVTPNVLHLRVESTRPDRLIVNQNFDPGWRVESGARGEPVSAGGLLALDLPAGSHEVVLRHRPRGQVAGAWITGIATLLAALFVLVRRRRPGSPPGRPSPAGAPGPRAPVDLDSSDP